MVLPLAVEAVEEAEAEEPLLAEDLGVAVSEEAEDVEGGEDASVPRDEEEGSVEEEEVKPVFCPLSLSSVVVRYLIRQKIDYILFTFLQKALHYNTSSADFTPWISAVSIFYILSSITPPSSQTPLWESYGSKIPEGYLSVNQPLF